MAVPFPGLRHLALNGSDLWFPDPLPRIPLLTHLYLHSLANGAPISDLATAFPSLAHFATATANAVICAALPDELSSLTLELYRLSLNTDMDCVHLRWFAAPRPRLGRLTLLVRPHLDPALGAGVLPDGRRRERVQAERDRMAEAECRIESRCVCSLHFFLVKSPGVASGGAGRGLTGGGLKWAGGRRATSGGPREASRTWERVRLPYQVTVDCLHLASSRSREKSQGCI